MFRAVCTALMVVALSFFATALPKLPVSNQIRFSDDLVCTGTPVLPNAILSATHCEEMTNENDEVIGYAKLVKVGLMTVTQVDVVRDGADHSFFFVSGHPFSPKEIHLGSLETNSSAFMYGCPDVSRGGCFNRVGHYLGQSTITDMTLDLFDFHIMPGDSGSLIFDEHENLIGVTGYWITGGFTGAKPLGEEFRMIWNALIEQ